MTIVVQNPTIEYVANGATTVFAYPFRILQQTDLQVFLNGVLQGAGFTVSGVDAPGGGNVTFGVAPVNGTIVTLTRNVPADQQVDYQPFDPFPAKTHERALDKLTMLVQQLQSQIVGGSDVLLLSGATPLLTLNAVGNVDANLVFSKNAAPKFTFKYAGSGTDDLILLRGAAEVVRVDSAGHIVHGGTPSISIGGIEAAVQLNGIDAGTAGLALSRYSVNVGGTQILQAKSRGAAIGAQGILNSGDIISSMSFHGSDGISFLPVANIQVSTDSDGAPGAGASMPGAILFSTTPNGSVGPVVPRVKIGMQGNVVLNMSGSALLTTATGGFPFVPTCAGVPTGVPNPLPTGCAPIIVDTTNNRWYFYSNGAWRNAGP